MNILSKVDLKKVLLLTGATLVIFYVLFNTVVTTENFIQVYRNSRISLLLTIVAIGATGPFLSSARWYYLLKNSGHNIPFGRCLFLIMSAWPLNILPGRLGDFGRNYPLRKDIPLSKTTGITLLEKAIDVIALIFISAIGFLLIDKFNISILFFGIGAAVVFSLYHSRSILNAIFPAAITSKIQSIVAAVEFNKGGKYLILAALVSMANWATSILEIYLLFKAFGADVRIITILAYIPLAIFMGLLPISIAGLGTRDSAIVAFFIDQATPAQSLAAGVGYSFIGYFLFALIGIPFFIREFRSLSSDNNIRDPAPHGSLE